MPRILLLGRDGQLGRTLDDDSILGEDRIAVGRRDCDLADSAAVTALLEHCRADIIVNAAAYTAVDRAEDEPDLAEAVNATAPALIAERAKRHGAILIHFSTDYVFSGEAGGARLETDPVGPLGVYGATKLAGEEAIRASGCRHVILRTAWVYSGFGSNFAGTMLRLARERESLSVVADQWGTPTATALLADVTRRFVSAFGEADSNRLFGLYHCAASGRTTWHEYAVFFLSCCAAHGVKLALDPADIRPIATEDYPTKAARPKNSLLSCRKLEQTLGVTMPDWREGVRTLAEQLAGDVE